ncbi:MAG TPA: LLM class F420-dependent oxidoreductase [Anaerolineales bacterium]|nr:LLM class F420-dependent oxidoreductase [Anaerolineales bacterium]
MRLGLNIGYSGAKIELPMDMIRAADEMGYYAVWTAEAYGSDAITPLTWIGALTKNVRLGTAIMQMPARTPAMTAMTAITLDQLSGGRFLLGLGLSGPQVVEGWHGQAYGKPLAKTREYVGVVRQILKREKPLTHTGDYYQIPYQGADATGLGKPLKSILHGRADMPLYLAAIGPKNVELAAEIADGWLPIFFSPEHYDQVFKPSVDAGLAKAGKTIAHFDIAPQVAVVVDDNLEVCWNMLKPSLALYIGGMGAKGKNFYYDLACRYGYEDAANTIQEFYLAGQRPEAIVSVPNELVDAVSLCGPKERIRERLGIWRNSPITTLNVAAFNVEAVRVMAELSL